MEACVAVIQNSDSHSSGMSPLWDVSGGSDHQPG
jgi:hypothetical protein